MQTFTQKAQNALSEASKYAKKLHQGYTGSEHILAGLLKDDSSVASKVLQKNRVELDRVLELIKELISLDSNVSVKEGGEYSPRALHIMKDSHHLAEKYGQSETGTEHLLMAMIREGENIAVRILLTIGASPESIYQDLLIAIGQDPARAREDLRKVGAGKNGKGSMISQYGVDMTQKAREGKLDPIVGRETEIARVVQILSRRTKNNPCLVGEPGVGKTAIVEGLAQRIVRGDVPPTVQDKRVFSLDLSGMVAGSKYRGEFEERIKRLIYEVITDGNIILFLDEVHTLIGAGGAEGAIDAANILKPSLARGELQLIGATTIAEYRKHIEKDAALERRFQPVVIEEPTKEEAVAILKGVKGAYEEHHKIAISDDAIEAAVSLSMRYINDRNLPDKAIDLIDEAAASARIRSMGGPDKNKELEEKIAQLNQDMEDAVRNGDFSLTSELKAQQDKLIRKLEKSKKKQQEKQDRYAGTIEEADIEKVVSMWTRIPVEKLAEKESERLLKLEDTLHKRVIGQEEAVTAVAKAMRRGRVGLKDPKRPIGSFLFLGPTGVGKTELSKALAQAMFGTEDALIRVDMSEYMEGHSVSKMIGSPPGYVGFDEGGQLTDKVRKNPYSVVLFDEVEKAHPDVFNVLLQVLDDGHITDSKGRKVSFKNTILIMTSNAGAQRIVDPKNLGFATETSPKKDYEKMKSAVMEEVKQSFKPEFINRIDDIIVFHQLQKEDMTAIVNLLSDQLKKRCAEQMDIHLTLSPALKEHLVTKYSDNKMGARPLKRAIQSVVEDALAEEILRGNVKSGDAVTAGFREEKVCFSVKNL